MKDFYILKRCKISAIGVCKDIDALLEVYLNERSVGNNPRLNKVALLSALSVCIPNPMYVQ
ncbi:hypothetical protein KSD_52970 [Ktedonobacter sp. SOSP1-85]|nr:hypothetical protein KSD_52970 [Ktedonobacter sp. SOSP1-85]